jgi:pyruvate/2-oxoglutarate/acetoin dehydrogenase E1 component
MSEAAALRHVAFREAIRDALAEELERDERVFLLGEDIVPGGVFNATPGLEERFGPERVIDTPISEMAFTAAAVAAAVRGRRPVVEIMFADFAGLVLDTLVNQASKYHWLSNGQGTVPLVVRTAVGAGGRLGACHSQTPTGWFTAEPGLLLVAPATPADAKGLLKAAIRVEEPVVFFEHKLLYGTKGDVPDGDAALVPLGWAAVRRPGIDVTLVAAMACVPVALEAAETLAAEGVDAEVVDLRTLAPLDHETVAASVAKTKHLVVVEEGPPSGGYAGDVALGALELAGPAVVARVSSPATPVPFAPALEDAWLPSAARVVAAVHEIL